MLFDRIERRIDALAAHVQFRLLMSAHPELARLTHDRERAWAVWFAAEGEGAWGRWGRAVAVLGAGPAAAGAIACRLAAEAGLLDRTTWPLIALAAAIGGLLAAARACEVLRRPRVRRRLLRALRRFGHDVCDRCGYDMSGHGTCPASARRCPECGGDVHSVA